jgi:hypothetical protein
MKSLLLISTTLLASLAPTSALAQTPRHYPPLSEYMMAPEMEIALARSAAPEGVSAHATIKILTDFGYKVAAHGDNGFVCIVMRGWGGPLFTPVQLRALVYDAKLRAPICFNPVASRTMLPLEELRTRLGIQGKDPDQIAEAVQEAYTKGELPKMETVAFAYMFSADQYLGAAAGSWHPHVMVYAPYNSNAMMGGNPPGSMLPAVGDDAGTPFAVTVIPVDHELAVKMKRN